MTRIKPYVAATTTNDTSGPEETGDEARTIVNDVRREYGNYTPRRRASGPGRLESSETTINQPRFSRTTPETPGYGFRFISSGSGLRTRPTRFDSVWMDGRTRTYIDVSKTAPNFSKFVWQ